MDDDEAFLAVQPEVVVYGLEGGEDPACDGEVEGFLCTWEEGPLEVANLVAVN